MSPYRHSETRWFRSSPRSDLHAPTLERVVQSAFPCSRVTAIEPLADGLRNANFKVHLDRKLDAIVIRIYEHDPSICRKELDLYSLLGGSVPIPEVIHAEPFGLPFGLNDSPPFAILRYVEGISFRKLIRTGNAAAIAQAAYSAGNALAAIGSVTFASAGWLGPGPTVTAPLLDSENRVPRFVDSCLASPELRLRMPAQLADATHALIWSSARQVSSLDCQSRLVHGDFGKRNLLVSDSGGRWSLAAVLDWEFAVSGSPLADVGHFLRYERTDRPRAEPHFRAGYLQAGGKLPEDWRYLARLVDLIALCEALTHDHLPEDVIPELIELVRATVENRDPHL